MTCVIAIEGDGAILSMPEAVASERATDMAAAGEGPAVARERSAPAKWVATTPRFMSRAAAGILARGNSLMAIEKAFASTRWAITPSERAARGASPRTGEGAGMEPLACASTGLSCADGDPAALGMATETVCDAAPALSADLRSTS